MATSGVYTLTRTRDEILRGAFRLLGLITGDGSRSNAEMANAEEALNMMISEWQADGLGLWLKEEVTLLLQHDTESFSLGSGSSGCHMSTSVGITALAADASSGASTIDVDSITGISDGDYIGIELSSDSFQWTTVNGTPSGSTVTLDDVLTGNACEDGVVAYYTTKAERPLWIENVRVIDSDGNETALSELSRQEYFSISDKDSDGTPNSYYFDPQMTYAKIYVWPVNSDVSTRLLYTSMPYIEVFDASSDNPHFPQEWFRAVKYNLAASLADEYPEREVSFNKVISLRERANFFYNRVRNFDQETTSVFFQPQLR